MAITPLEDGSDRSIDARSIVTLIVFFVCNALVIYPLRIPFPLFLSRGCDALQDKISFEIPCERHEKIPKSPSSSSINAGVGETSTLPPAEELESSSTNRNIAQPQDPDQRNVHVREEKAVDSDTPCARRCRCKRLYFPLDLRTVPVIGVLLLLASTCIPPSVVRRGIVGSSGVKPYDIMTLFTCFAYISISLDCTGLLRYLAFLISSKSTASGGGRRLYNSFYLFFALIGLMFGNDPLILSGTPFLSYFTSHSAIEPPTAFLFSHFQVSNLVSAFLVSSNPTNLVLTSAFGISFLKYSAWLALPTIGSAIILFPTLKWIVFNKKGLIPHTIYPPHINPRDALVDPFGAVFNATVFIITVVSLVGLSAGHLLEGTEGVWTVTVPAAGLVFIRNLIDDWRKREERVTKKQQPRGTIQSRITGTGTDTGVAEKRNTADLAPQATTGAERPNGGDDTTVEARPQDPVKQKRLIPFRPLSPFTDNFPNTSVVLSRCPWPLLPFAFSFFILVEGLQHTGWIRVFGDWWGHWESVGGVAGSVWLMGVLSVIGCNIFGTNIGATILLARVLQHWGTTRTVSDRSLYGAIFSLAVGSNFGAYSFV
nr:uncharacterized protein I303_04030 [Kwoniella dejecticola CBS 10117]OBR86306.1 hypothetical protein I303_04030 [Kwoniella dejecticola CBS 10117]